MLNSNYLLLFCATLRADHVIYFCEGHPLKKLIFFSDIALALQDLGKTNLGLGLEEDQGFFVK